MKKSYLILLSVSAILAIYAFSSSKKNNDKELSYKTGKQESRYLKNFAQADYIYPDDLSAEIPDAKSSKQTILSQLDQAGQSAEKMSWFEKVQDEHIYIYISDLGNFRLTLDINEGKYSIHEGFDTTRPPTMVIPMNSLNVAHLAEILQDGKITYEEQYRIYYVIAIPALQAIYHNPVLYKPGDKSIFQFDDLLHLVIKPEQEVNYMGHPIHIEATIANVDGQWLVFRGLQGDPDYTVTVTLNEATDLYKMGFYEVRNIKSPADAKALSEKFLHYLHGVTSYERKDHMMD